MYSAIFRGGDFEVHAMGTITFICFFLTFSVNSSLDLLILESAYCLIYLRYISLYIYIDIILCLGLLSRSALSGGTPSTDLRTLPGYNAVVESNGTVIWACRISIIIPCSFDLHGFPWDQVSCTAYVGMWSYRNSTVTLDMGSHRWFPTVHGIWAFKNMTATQEHDGLFQEDYSLIKYELVAVRKSLYYEIYMLFPSVLFAGMSLLSFCFPLKCPEKVSLSLTLLLSESVLLFSSLNFIPVQSQVIPELCEFHQRFT